MVSVFSKILRYGVIAGFAFTTFGCGGGGSNNDQGVAFTLNGFAPAGSKPDEDGLNGLVSVFGTAVSTVSVELQNNLYGQGIRVQRIFLSYNIAGANISIPDTSFGMTQVLGPVECADKAAITCASTTLPEGFKQKNIVRAPFFPVPASITEYLTLNRDSLPELPFTLEVSVSAEGITTSGDTLRSNSGTFTVEYTADNAIGSGDGISDSSSDSSSSAA